MSLIIFFLSENRDENTLVRGDIFFRSEVAKDWEVGGMFREFIRIRVKRFVLLVSTISDASVEIFAVLSCRGFLFNITTDRFTKLSYVNCTS